jgi:osmotically-inducible protein OsmY
MKVRHLIGAMAVAGIVFAPPAALAQAAQTPSTAQKVDDGALKSRIESRLKSSESLKDSDIDVAVDNGVVTLTGTVHSEAQSVRASSLAKVSGVTNIENKLKVGSTTARTMDKAGEEADRAMDKAADKTAEKIDKAADKSASTAQKAGHEAEKVGKQTTAKGKDAVSDVDANINDAWITTKVKTNFIDEDALKGSDINVDSNHHVVTLKGTVPSAAGRTRAVELAKSTKGVTRVVDQLTIAPPK